MNKGKERITYIVGEEKRLAEIVSRAEVEPLLNSLVQAGPVWSALLDEDGLPIAQAGNDAPLNPLETVRLDLLVEGEPRGVLVVAADSGLSSKAEPLAKLVQSAIQLTINNNLKRMLTTEMHSTVVQESYEQLVKSNRCLSESENRYRQLAITLEQKVLERSADLQKAYSRMLQQEKLAAVGCLAAGMAHEINNPNGYILSNLNSFQKYIGRISEMFSFFRMLLAMDVSIGKIRGLADSRWQELKMDFLLNDSLDLLKQSIDGSERIARIVADLKSFSHVDESGISDADLNVEIERTLKVLAPQIPADAVIECKLDPLPKYACNPGLISQAFLNIIQNAVQSRNEQLRLVIESHYSEETITISFSDNGNGISGDFVKRVFEPFFTTQEVGNGTGMGLTVAREIIKASGGNIELDSQEGQGTTVTILLPTVGGEK